jgi:hypothetical protein
MDQVKCEVSGKQPKKRMVRLTREEWQAVFTDWQSGMGFDQCADKYGMPETTIRQRARIKDWNGLRTRSFYKDDNEADKSRLEQKTMAEMAEEFRRKIGEDAMRVLEHVKTWSPAGLSPAATYTREKILELLQKRAWQSLGLDEAKTTQVVNINVMAALAKQPAWRMRNGVTLEIGAAEGEHALPVGNASQNEGGRAPQAPAEVISNSQQVFSPKLRLSDPYSKTPVTAPSSLPSASSKLPLPESLPSPSKGLDVESSS